MYNFLRCRRGSAAFATVIALVPLIGVVALGGEAGSWYVTKQHAQNAADAAAIAGGWSLGARLHRALYPVGHLVEGVPELLHLAGALYLPGSS